jgi:hypothetical protein
MIHNDTDSDRLAAALSGAHLDGDNTGRRCKLARIIDTVSPANRDTLTAHLAGALSNARLAKMLTLGGHPISPAQLGNHRAGLCICTATRQDTAA